ncbi:MAG: glycoside hydrolase family 31 protein [Christensenellaceae bacterium]|jgi:alpha-glucosidase (family GH31 glycosyl hydrolase)|nr:glycoside hydrolase family 31 protein [Christensenellaceae bacterium]
MNELSGHLIANTQPLANENQIILTNDMRLTVLTPTLLRLETAHEGVFNDASTQIVWFRNLGEFKKEITEDQKYILLKTDEVEFKINKKKKRVDFVTIDGDVIRCNNRKNLKGTTRTLDMSFGKRKLYPGIIGSNGVAVMEDDSLVLDADGMFKYVKRGSDVYVFASKDFKKSLKAFFEITGMPPMIPRYALGNWWSRYHEYTQEEYLTLMRKFESEGIPISVATIDMDWHWVNIAKEFGPKYKKTNGWTGYSWNTKLFPDYKAMFNELKEKGYKLSLNLHPAKGVRDYESMYREMCIEMGTDPKSENTIEFDFTDPKFINAYFKVLHNPYEDDGLDVWWIDWQQGKKSKIKGYDPLWGLNHYHYLDAARDGKRPFVLSRYAGLGSHRYPVGFSGDTAINWRVLNFQPYFTVNAANAGYLTWSHDIGGHHLGNPNDEELYLRWVQFGVFSPIMRLHSTKAVRGKEPWTFPGIYSELKRQLVFRHKLIPYIYTAYHRAFSECRPICEPLYYRYPNRSEAYSFKNQYFFGENILVAPITEPADKAGVSKIDVWLPENKRYIDIFTGRVYAGNTVIPMKRDRTSIPVLATEGTILPLAVCENNKTDNPKAMEVLVFCGNGSFTLYEDDGVSEAYKQGEVAQTDYSIKIDGGNAIFEIMKASGCVNLIPDERDYEIIFKDLKSYKTVDVSVDGKRVKYFADTNSIGVGRVKVSSHLVITLTDVELEEPMTGIIV